MGIHCEGPLPRRWLFRFGYLINLFDAVLAMLPTIQGLAPFQGHFPSEEV